MEKIPTIRRKEPMKSLVLLSGGQDSTTCLYWAKDKFSKVSAIGFDYGQSHKIELEQAKKIAQDAQVPFSIIDVKGLITGSSLVNNQDHNSQSPINSDLPASFAPARNLLFLTLAGSLAVQKGITDLVIGVCQTDYSGYPDCRRNTIDALQLTLSLGLGVGDIRIHTPLMYLTKAETFKLAKDLNCLEIIINDTMTDYNGDQTINEWGKGLLNNPASILRANGYTEAKNNGWI